MLSMRLIDGRCTVLASTFFQAQRGSGGGALGAAVDAGPLGGRKMTWRKRWRGREIAIRDARWWRDGKLTVDDAVADPKPCNDYFSMFGLYAAHVRDELGTPHQIEVVQIPWLAGRSLYQLVVDGVVLSPGSRRAPAPPDWPLREATEARGSLRFVLLYWRSAVLFPVLILGLRYLKVGFPSVGQVVYGSFLVFGASFALHAAYASVRWYYYVRVNRCRRRKLFGTPAAQQCAAADVAQRVPIELW